MSEDDTRSTAAEMRSMAEQAEAEAAAADALAVAARARARAVQLRRQAELVDATEEATEGDEAHPDEPGQGNKNEVEDTQPEIEPEGSRPEAESVRTEESSDDTAVESEADVPSGVASDAAAHKPAYKPGSYRRWPSRSGRPRLSTIAASLAVIVILASLAGGVYVILEHRDVSQQHQRAAEFAAAARQGVVTLTSLDFNNAKRDVQRVIDNSTGAFRDDFQKTADDFITVVEQSQVVEQGTVQAVAVDLDSMTSDSAVVLVASTSEVTNAAGAKQDPRSFRLIVTVTRDRDQIKMSKVEFVP